MNFLAQSNPFGTVNAPPGVNKFAGGDIQGIPLFINIILRTLVLGAGLYALFNLILAGYAFLSAGGDPKAIAGAWAKIWQSILGLAVTASAFIIAAIIGILLFGDATRLLRITIFGI
jgi:hypothetical protein